MTTNWLDNLKAGDRDLEVAVIRFQFMPLQSETQKPKQLTLL